MLSEEEKNLRLRISGRAAARLSVLMIANSKQP